MFFPPGVHSSAQTVLPEDLLKIEGTEPTYEMHNLINLTCVSGASYPAQTLTWFINEERVSDSEGLGLSLTASLMILRSKDLNARSKIV